MAGDVVNIKVYSHEVSKASCSFLITTEMDNNTESC
ncbi:hypothetical protein Cycma_1396 [Cyclobacterium marinum DSM 745]|uniref:Uncharacterized protein n=1 Tax=Cyclobacterium marinum (strain ATCC 25205 / DSM 745 / LMG 13164 / NCIMB 1802) TaxID=880070 RepID=G0J292_CYCMS|nr:hypothetical protein Cycma_1396 [Cyclobacterium marinum DSM 745]